MFTRGKWSNAVLRASKEDVRQGMHRCMEVGYECQPRIGSVGILPSYMFWQDTSATSSKLCRATLFDLERSVSRLC